MEKKKVLKKEKSIQDQVLSEVKNNLIVLAVIYLVVGLVMVIAPASVSNIVCYIVALLLIALGVSGAVTYMRSVVRTPFINLTLFMSILFIIFGVYIYASPEVFASFVPLVIGIFLLLDSANKVQLAFNLKEYNYEDWWHTLVIAIIIFGFGVFLVANPFTMVTLFIRIMGIMLIVDGCSNLLTLYNYYKM